MPSDKELWQKWQQLADVEARNELVLRYMPAIFKRSMKYPVNHLVSRHDLIQEGVIGLIKAVDKWDPSRSENFFNCAYYYIMDTMFEYSMKYVPTADGWSIYEGRDNSFEERMIDEIDVGRIVHILDTECTKNQRLGLYGRISSFQNGNQGLGPQQIKRGYDKAVQHIRYSLKLSEEAPRKSGGPRRLTLEQVGYVRVLLKQGRRSVDIAKEVGVSAKIIGDIKNGVTYND